LEKAILTFDRRERIQLDATSVVLDDFRYLVGHSQCTHLIEDRDNWEKS